MKGERAPATTVRARAHPSLAICKYWGKQPDSINIPATPSVGVTLEGLTAETTVSVKRSQTDEDGSPRQDRVVLDGVTQDARRFKPFFDALREEFTEYDFYVDVESRNNFPTAAGLASSAAGFAALAAGAIHALTGADDRRRSSRLARIGSGSACRSIYGGFTRWDAGAREAIPVYPESWWPELRVVVLPVTTEEKPLSSRDAMNRSRDTSPFYPRWIEDAQTLAAEVESAIAHRDLQKLGETAGLSYLRMFGTMISADPPILYWLPETVRILHELHRMRTQGIPAWETMDAGPQVKVFTHRDDAERIAAAFEPVLPVAPIICAPGPGVEVFLHPGAESE